MFQVLLDSVMFGISDAITGGVVSPSTVIVFIGVVALAIFALLMRVRLDEARQKSSQTNVNVMPSQTGLYVGICILVLLVFLMR